MIGRHEFIQEISLGHLDKRKLETIEVSTEAGAVTQFNQDVPGTYVMYILVKV